MQLIFYVGFHSSNIFQYTEKVTYNYWTIYRITKNTGVEMLS